MKDTKPKEFCFVLMPFDESFNDVYQFGIKGACEDIDVYCERVDEQVFVGSMLERIYNQIAKADILVADMSGRNPNVFYEVGYAHALGKNVVLLTQDTQDIPFDLKHFPHIVYNKAISKLRPELARRIEHLLKESPQQSETTIALEIYLNDKPLSLGAIDHYYNENVYPSVKLTLGNSSLKTYHPGSFRIAAITPSEYSQGWNNQVQVTTLPNGCQLHMLPEFDTLFPGAFTSFEFIFPGSYNEAPDDIPMTVRVFTDNGFRDFNMTLKMEA